jgi:uncharacterized protein (DUF433 family)
MALADRAQAEIESLWAEPEARLSAGDLMEENDWTTNFFDSVQSDRFLISVSSRRKSVELRSLEWYLECSLLGSDTLREVVQIDPDRHGGVPVLRGTRFTVAQALAELAESSGVEEVATNYDLDVETIRATLTGLSMMLMRPFSK